jgi:agmatinase
MSIPFWLDDLDDLDKYPRVGIVGLPLDFNSSHKTGAAEAPRVLMDNIFHPSQNSCAENGVDLKCDDLKDLGDLVLKPKNAFDVISNASASLRTRNIKPLFIGGDHSVTWPIIDGFQNQIEGGLTILHIDAHSDTYDDFEGNPWSHASPFARIMELNDIKGRGMDKGLNIRLIQMGIRTMTSHMRDQVKKFGIESIEMKDYKPGWLPEISGPVYMSIDLDGIDPAFAPGVSHREPGGLTTREVLGLIQHVGPNLVGADFVEYNPSLDIDNQALMVGVKIIKELAGQMIANKM